MLFINFCHLSKLSNFFCKTAQKSKTELKKRQNSQIQKFIEAITFLKTHLPFLDTQFISYGFETIGRSTYNDPIVEVKVPKCSL